MEAETEVFRGNIVFASKSSLEFNVTSRRDDIISACYNLVYLLNQGKLLNLDAVTYNESKNSPVELMKISLANKQKQTLEKLCCDEAACLKDFAEYVFSLSFESQPDYKKLRELLADALKGDPEIR